MDIINSIEKFLSVTQVQAQFIAFVGIFLIAFVTHFITRKILIKVIFKLSKKTSR